MADLESVFHEVVEILPWNFNAFSEQAGKAGWIALYMESLWLEIHGIFERNATDMTGSDPYVAEFRHVMKNAALRVEKNLGNPKQAYFWIDVFKENVGSILPTKADPEIVQDPDIQFSSSIREIAGEILKAVSLIHERIVQNAKKENDGADVTDNFLSVITELQECIDPHLSKVLPILQEFNKADSLNVGTDLLHIWYGCWRMLSSTTYLFQKQIHPVVDGVTNQVSFWKGYPRPWNALAKNLKGYMKRNGRIAH